VNGVRLYDYASSGNCYNARLLLALTDNNPARETPVLELDDGEVVVQSNAVLWYLAEGRSYLPDSALARARGRRALAMLDEHLAAREWVAADACTIADISLPGFMDDYVPYPDNARPGRGRSIYDG
jgi:glutathione S-transferase